MDLRALLALGLLALAPGIHAAEECGWLSNAAVAKAFPKQAPWQTMVGGQAGSCQFLGKGGNIFAANQMIKGSASEATAFVRDMKGSMDKSFVIEPAPKLGQHGFAYRSKGADGTIDDNALQYVGHHDRIVIIGSINLRSPISPEMRSAGETLLQSAFTIAYDEQVLDAAQHCPYFDEPTLKKLLPGKGMTQQTYGSNSCMAQDGGLVVLVSIVPSRDATAKPDSNCSGESIDDLMVNWDCKGGRPHGKVSYVAGGNTIEFTFAPGREATAAERELTIELARKARARR